MRTNALKNKSLRTIVKTFIGIVLAFGLTSNKPIVLRVDLKLLETGWDKHFENHEEKSKKTHFDFGKFQTLDEKKTFMVFFILPKDFDSKTLKKGNAFDVGLAAFGDLDSINEEVKINVKNKKDLESHEIRLMMDITPK